MNLQKVFYSTNQADDFAQQRHQVKDKFVKLTTECKHLINSCLKLDWSPEQICGWFNASNIIQLHHESVYRYLLKDKANGGLLYQHLRHQGKPYRKRYGYPNNRTGIPNRVDIDERPEAVGCNSYFAKPYHSWERGQNENANGLLRQYFPKSMRLINIAINDVKIAVDKLNSRPRKCLGFKTPYQVFFEMTGIDARQLGVVHL